MLEVLNHTKGISEIRNGKTTGYGYDANGNKTSVTDWRSNVTSNAYDGLNRLIQTTDATGAVVSRLTYNAKHL